MPTHQSLVMAFSYLFHVTWTTMTLNNWFHWWMCAHSWFTWYLLAARLSVCFVVVKHAHHTHTGHLTFQSLYLTLDTKRCLYSKSQNLKMKASIRARVYSMIQLNLRKVFASSYMVCFITLLSFFLSFFFSLSPLTCAALDHISPWTLIASDDATRSLFLFSPTFTALYCSRCEVKNLIECK